MSVAARWVFAPMLGACSAPATVVRPAPAHAEPAVARTCPALADFLVVAGASGNRLDAFAAIGRIPQNESVWIFGSDGAPCETAARHEVRWENQTATELVGECVITFPALAFRGRDAGACRMAPAKWAADVPAVALSALPIARSCKPPTCDVWTDFHAARLPGGLAALSLVASERRPSPDVSECAWPTTSHWLKFLAVPGKPLRPLRLEGELLGFVHDGGRPIALAIVSERPHAFAVNLFAVDGDRIADVPLSLSFESWEAKGGYAPAVRSSCSP